MPDSDPAPAPRPALPRFALCLGVFLTSVALIVLQVTLTRIFSVMIWNHLSFMAITVSLLGFSLAGLVFFLAPVLLRISTPWLLTIGTVGFGLGLVKVGMFILQSQTIEAQLLEAAGGSAFARQAATHYLLWLLLWLVVPFFFAGWTISAAIVKEARDVGKVYASNLIGSGAACLAVIVCLNTVGAFRTLMVVLALVTASLICYAWRRERKWLTAVIGVPALGFIGFTVFKTVELAEVEKTTQLIKPIAVTKKRTDALGRTIVRKWNSFSCVDFYPIVADQEGFWGLNRRVYTGPIPDNIGVLIDSWALTTVINYTEGLEKDPVFAHVPSSVAYEMFGLSGKAPEVLVIGSGGGIDVLTAKHHGAKHVTAVEINPLIVNGSKRVYPELRGEALRTRPGFEQWTDQSVYELPGVEVHVAEGRHFVDRSEKRFDMIMIPGVDTATGTEAGNFSFSENYLYTTDAMRAYLDKLEDGGLCYVLRFRPTKDRPSEMLRLAAIAEAALAEQGVAEPWKQIVVYDSNVHVFACLVMKKGGAFTAAELAKCHEKLGALRYSPLFAPDKAPGSPHAEDFHDYLKGDAASRETMLANYPYRVAPVTDDEPFFFNFTHVKDVLHLEDELEKGDTHALYYIGQTVLYYCLAVVAALGILFVLLPLIRFAFSRQPIHARFRFVGYFLCLGFAYIVVEIMLMQKFVFYLGYPVYAMTVILFSLLTFSGIGSFVSSRVNGRTGATVIFALLLVAQVAMILSFERITAATFDQSFWTRVAIAVAITGPLGLLMGMPFPLGIRIAETCAKPMLPWIWALNGYASVLGSVLAVALAIHVGFSVVLWIAIGTYALAFLLLASILKSRPLAA